MFDKANIIELKHNVKINYLYRSVSTNVINTYTEKLEAMTNVQSLRINIISKVYSVFLFYIRNI